MRKAPANLRLVAAAASPLARLVADYLTHCKAIGLSPKTTKFSYGYPLLHVLLPWAADRGIESVEQLSSRDLDAFAVHLDEQGGVRGELTISTRWTYLKAVKRFLAWAKEDGETVTAGVTLPKLPQRMVEVLTAKEVTQLEDAAQSERDKLIVRVLAESGIRRAELTGLTTRDLLEEGGRHYLLIHGKGSIDRKVPVAPAVARRLRRYIAGRPSDADSNRVFLGLRRRPDGSVEPLTESGVTQLVVALGERVLGKRIGPHLFRHTAATMMLRRGIDSVLVAQILGHRSLQMIQKVYSHLQPTDAHEALMKALKAADDE